MIVSVRYPVMLFVAGVFSIVPALSFAADAGTAAKEAEAEITAAIGKLPDADKTAAIAQRWCAVQQANRLGAMGTPVKVVVDGKPVLLCCQGCQKKALAGGKATLKAAETLKKANVALNKLTPADRELAEAQRFCAVMDGSLLGGMGTPVKVTIEGKPVFLCCPSCEEEAQANPKDIVAKVAQLKKANSSN
jgi:hypothetical protein